MNSERIERKFGSYGVEIVESGPLRRVSSLYSLEQGRRVCRTWAIVEFLSPGEKACAAEHARVQAGESIGRVFRDRGWQVRKRHVAIGETALGRADEAVARKMDLAPPLALARHGYVFEVSRGDAVYDYAAITELHHPDYLSPRDLQALYGDRAGAGPAFGRPVAEGDGN